jgi:hypothetical protein
MTWISQLHESADLALAQSTAPTGSRLTLLKMAVHAQAAGSTHELGDNGRMHVIARDLLTRCCLDL